MARRTTMPSDFALSVSTAALPARLSCPSLGDGARFLARTHRAPPGFSGPQSSLTRRPKKERASVHTLSDCSLCEWGILGKSN